MKEAFQAKLKRLLFCEPQNPSGLLYLFAGAVKLGFIANFLSQPIRTGYLNGIALIIIVGHPAKLLA